MLRVLLPRRWRSRHPHEWTTVRPCLSGANYAAVWPRANGWLAAPTVQRYTTRKQAISECDKECEAGGWYLL